MRHLIVIVAVICAAIGDGWAQNRGNVRYVAPEDFDGDITRAPRPAPTRAAAVRRTRPTKAPEPPSVDEEPKGYQPPETPSRTTARRVPQRNSPQHVVPPPPPPVPFPVEDAVSRYPIPAEEPQVPLTKPEDRPQGTRRRRPKKRRRPQNALPKENDEAEKQAVRREENTSILDLINEDKKRTDLFPNSPPSRNNPSTYVPDPSYQPEKAPFESDPPKEHQANAAGSQYYRPQPATNRLPAGNSRGYLDSATEGPAPYVPERPAVSVQNDASYVPILNPIRVPSEGASRLPPEDYPGIQSPARPVHHSDPNIPLRGHISEADPKEIIRDINARPVLNVIPESDVPVRSHSEVRLPENEQPVLSEYVPPSYDSAEDQLSANPKDPEGNKEPPTPTNRLPNPSEIHYDSTYPEYSDYTHGPQVSAKRRQETNPYNPNPSYSTPRRGTKPQEYDNDAEVDRRQASRYTPPLQRTGSRYKAENLEESSRSRAQEHTASTAVPRTRGSSRYQSPESEYAPERTRGAANKRTETPPDSSSKSRSSTASQSNTRARGSQRHTPEKVENTPRTSSRRQIPNDGSQLAKDTASTGYDDLTKDHPSPSHPQSTYSELQDYGSVRNTLRSRPQYEAREEEPADSYEESVEDKNVYNPYPVPRQANTRERANQRAPIASQPPQPEYHTPPNRQQSRSQYEPPQNPRSRHQPQYVAPQNPRTDSRQATNRQNAPSSGPQGRTRHQSPEAAPSPRRPSGGSNFACPEAFGFFADPVQCDKYYECRNGTAEMNLCNDGLGFNEISAPKFLRCDSLRDVDCKSRPELQEAQPTKNCPRKYGLFPHETDCTKFWNCVDGVSTEVQCPPGLTYNDERATCDWADLVETSCKTEDLLGFTCPEPTAHDLLDGVYSRYPHPDNCQLHFTCIKGADGLRRPRMLSCNEGLVFDPASSSCKRPEEVPGCEDFYGVRSPAPKRKPARQPEPEPEPEEIVEEAPRSRRRGSNRRIRN